MDMVSNLQYQIIDLDKTIKTLIEEKELMNLDLKWRQGLEQREAYIIRREIELNEWEKSVYERENELWKVERPEIEKRFAIEKMRELGFFEENNKILEEDGSGSFTAKEKGDLFEKNCSRKFDNRYIKIIHWRSDKGSDGVYAESNKYPDFELKYNSKQKRFAVECKYRASWKMKDGVEGIDWASDRQIENYNKYTNEHNIPVFVVIGVGGEPNNPDDLFIIPLQALKYPHAQKRYLERFLKKKKEANFFFDAENLSLS